VEDDDDIVEEMEDALEINETKKEEGAESTPSN
jgi:hypothetical protein